MFADLAKAIAQLGEPATRGVLFKSLALAVLALVLMTAGLTWGISALHLFEAAWLEWIKSLLGGLLALVIAWLTFPAAVALVASLFLGTVARAVERRYYPHLPVPREQPLREALFAGLRIAGLTVLLNLLALPVYLFSALLAPVVFAAVNGYIAGRDYFGQIAERRMSPAEAAALRRQQSGEVFFSGVVIALLMLVPILNLFTPVLATAFMLHRFERLRYL